MSLPDPNGWQASLPLGREVKVITRDANGLVALSKPSGVLSHPNSPQDQPRSVLTCRYALTGEFFEWAAGASGDAMRRLYLLNRLDSATSGVILAAESEALAREIRSMFQKRHVRKVYNALCFGTPSNAQQVWRDMLAVDKRGGQIRTHGAGNIPAECQMKALRTRRGERPMSLLALEPKTGRSHQLRVQCAKRHLPIVGDATYGDFAANREFAKATGIKRMFLHSLETSFDYTWRGKTYHFEAHADLPEEFSQV